MNYFFLCVSLYSVEAVISVADSNFSTVLFIFYNIWKEKIYVVFWSSHAQSDLELWLWCVASEL